MSEDWWGRLPPVMPCAKCGAWAERLVHHAPELYEAWYCTACGWCWVGCHWAEPEQGWEDTLAAVVPEVSGWDQYVRRITAEAELWPARPRRPFYGKSLGPATKGEV